MTDHDGALYTLGHSNRSAAGLLGLLRDNRIELLIDIRAFPRSRRFPHFDRRVLEDILASREIAYYWAGDLLGGFRKPRPDSPNGALTDAAFRGFADYMASDAFAAGIADVLARSRGRRSALMCAEADYHHCHRQFIADHLLAHGHEVRHLGAQGECWQHGLHPCLDSAARPPVYNKHAQGELFTAAAED